MTYRDRRELREILQHNDLYHETFSGYPYHEVKKLIKTCFNQCITNIVNGDCKNIKTINQITTNNIKSHLRDIIFGQYTRLYTGKINARFNVMTFWMCPLVELDHIVS
jgi:hypothetical protein